MPWPSQASDLNKDKIKIGDKLESFLNTVLSREVAMSKSDIVSEVKTFYWTRHSICRFPR